MDIPTDIITDIIADKANSKAYIIYILRPAALYKAKAAGQQAI